MTYAIEAAGTNRASALSALRKIAGDRVITAGTLQFRARHGQYGRKSTEIIARCEVEVSEEEAS